MAVLLEKYIRDGEDMRSISGGVEILISMQADILRDTSDALGEEVDRIRGEKFELRNLDQIAAIFGVRGDLVRSIVSAAVGVRKSHLEPVTVGGGNAAA